MKRWHIGGAAVAMLAAGLSAPATGSGGPSPSPTFIDSRGGRPAELARLHNGRLGLILPDGRTSTLYLGWRLLHGLKVGPEAGLELTSYCCGREFVAPDAGEYGWQAARRLVTGEPGEDRYIRTDIAIGDYQYVVNCNVDAFDTATATLKDRIAKHGATSPAVKAWLAAQDAVFDVCGTQKGDLPEEMADALEWLKKDRAYQRAAIEFYKGHYDEAATRFGVIARDRKSPWRPMGLYLKTRSALRQAINDRLPESFARARGLLNELQASPEGTFGKAEVGRMSRALAFRDRPAELKRELDRDLNLREPIPHIAEAFRDYELLTEKPEQRTELADWIATMRAWDGDERAAPRARERWAATKDVAWLIAALVTAQPGDEAAAGLLADAAKVAADHPGWLTVQYHSLRLGIAKAPAAETRARVDAILARKDLSLGERNIFLGVRTQVSTDLPDFLSHALRQPYCNSKDPKFCVDNEGWGGPYGFDTGLGKHARLGFVGFGIEAQALIDRMPLDTRIALSRMPDLPRELKLDVALTSFPRAVQLHDDAAMVGLARDLAELLPQLRSEWNAVVTAKPGPDRLFAAGFAMAKLPGLSADLGLYWRPQGTVPQFQGTWEDFMVLPAPLPLSGSDAVQPPGGNWYNSDGVWNSGDDGDLVCRGKCGAGAFALTLPPFLEAQRRRIETERNAFVVHSGSDSHVVDYPKGTFSLWEMVLEHARANPRDPRSPEALYWLIRIARWGANHDHSGKRAFQLLHARYPGSDWAKRSPYYYD